jgi:hypothetical protein
MPIPAPAGFQYTTAGPSRVLADERRAGTLLAEGIGRPPFFIDAARRRGGGRGGVYHLTLGGEDIVMRVYKRGGLPRLLLNDRSLDDSRSFREIVALAAAAERGVPAVTPVAAVAMSAGVGLYRHYLFTILEYGALPLLDVLGSPHCDHARKIQIIEAAAAVIRSAFQQGIEPADLHARNILIAESDRIICKLVDLDGAIVTPGPLPPAVRTAVLARFTRYLARHADDGGRALSRADLARMIRIVEGDSWKSTWRAVQSRIARTRFLHRIGSLWQPPASPAGRTETRGGPAIGPEAALKPAISFVFVASARRDAASTCENIINTAAGAGVASYEIVAAAVDATSLSQLRSLSLTFPSLRFLGGEFRLTGLAWRAALRAARGERIIGIEPDGIGPRFLTEALERMQVDTDLVVGGGAPGASLRRGAVDLALRFYLRLWRRCPSPGQAVTFAARHDDRFEAALRAVKSTRLTIPEFIGRLREAGATVREVAVDPARTQPAR